MDNGFLSAIISDSFWEKEKHNEGCLKMLYVVEELYQIIETMWSHE